MSAFGPLVTILHRRLPFDRCLNADDPGEFHGFGANDGRVLPGFKFSGHVIFQRFPAKTAEMRVQHLQTTLGKSLKIAWKNLGQDLQTTFNETFSRPPVQFQLKPVESLFAPSWILVQSGNPTQNCLKYGWI